MSIRTNLNPSVVVTARSSEEAVAKLADLVDAAPRLRDAALLEGKPEQLGVLNERLDVGRVPRRVRASMQSYLPYVINRDNTVDVAVIGGGIVGLAAARAVLTREPDTRLCVVEKEPAPAMHQTGRNSGVVHAGIYYAPGSLKARLCTAGRMALKEYTAEKRSATTSAES